MRRIGYQRPRTSKTRRQLAWLASGFICLYSQVASAQESYNRLYRSAYFLGRGDTGISVADYEDAIFYNPAGLAAGSGIYKRVVLLSPQIEVSHATRDLGRRLVLENADAVDAASTNIGKPNHFGLNNFTGIILRRAALGAFTSGQVDLLAYKSKDYGGLEVVQASAVQNAGATFSLAESFWQDSLLLGVTGKYLMRGRGEFAVSIAEIDEAKEKLSDPANFMGYGMGGGADLGLMYRVKSRLSPSFGLTIADVGNTRIIPQEETDLDLDVKQTINAGFSIEPGTKFSKLRLLADYRDITGSVIKNPRKKIHLGNELTIVDTIGITSGFHHGYASGGLYFDAHFIRLDLGAYTEEVGERVGTRADTRYFFRLRLGF